MTDRTHIIRNAVTDLTSWGESLDVLIQELQEADLAFDEALIRSEYQPDHHNYAEILIDLLEAAITTAVPIDFSHATTVHEVMQAVNSIRNILNPIADADWNFSGGGSGITWATDPNRIELNAVSGETIHPFNEDQPAGLYQIDYEIASYVGGTYTPRVHHDSTGYELGTARTSAGVYTETLYFGPFSSFSILSVSGATAHLQGATLRKIS